MLSPTSLTASAQIPHSQQQDPSKTQTHYDMWPQGFLIASQSSPLGILALPVGLPQAPHFEQSRSAQLPEWLE
jgi:hypothetical protein